MTNIKLYRNINYSLEFNDIFQSFNGKINGKYKLMFLIYWTIWYFVIFFNLNREYWLWIFSIRQNKSKILINFFIL